MKSIDKLVAILRKMGSKSEKVIEHIEKKSPELAAIIRKKMFMFEDIASLRREDISLIIRGVPTKTLVISLKGTDESFRDIFYSALTKRAAETLKDDLEITGPVKRSEVDSARGEIIDYVLKLIDEGRIDKDSSDEIYV